MRRFFGTDGIRGKVNLDLMPAIAFKCGNALTQLHRHPKVLIGRDTRQSGDLLAMGVSTGVTAGGGNVLDVGIIPTAAVAYLTKHYGADYGVVISASHNPPEYNGIKIFGADGYKLSEEMEERIEECFATDNYEVFPNFGSYKQVRDADEVYVDYVRGTVEGDLSGMKVILDCSNGAAHKVAPMIFEELGATVVATFTESDGININNACGSLYPEVLARKVVETGADVGFAFDGDSDRLTAVDANGNVIDGDKIIYALASHMLQKGALNPLMVVGTHHTNMGIQRALEAKGIELLRADIGDKYVMEMMVENGAVLGGEQSGHVILLQHATTGDGILSACHLAKVIKDTGKTLAELLDGVDAWPQTNINLEVKDKIRLMNNEGFSEYVDACRSEISGKGRILVRASGTEPKIRIMVECMDGELARDIANRIAQKVRSLKL